MEIYIYKCDEMGKSTQTHTINFCQRYLGDQRENRGIPSNYIREKKKNHWEKMNFDTYSKSGTQLT